VNDPNVDDVLQDIPSVLGVPFLNLLFRRLSEYPAWLRESWHSVRPILLTPAFDAASSLLCAFAAPPQDYVDERYRDRLRTVSPEALDSMIRLTDAYAHVQPRLLLLAAGWEHGMRAIVSQHIEKTHRDEAEVRTLGTPTTPNIWDPEADVPMADLALMPPTVQLIIHQMATERRHPGLASYYRSVASLPGVLASTWESLRPYMRDSRYHDAKRQLGDLAAYLARSLGIDVTCARAIDSAETGELQALLVTWKNVQVPELTLDTACVRALLNPESSGWPPYANNLRRPSRTPDNL